MKAITVVVVFVKELVMKRNYVPLAMRDDGRMPTIVDGCPMSTCVFNRKGECIAWRIELADPDLDPECDACTDDTMICKTYKRK